MSCSELIDHLELSERYPFVWCSAIEPDKVVIAFEVESFHLAEQGAEHRKRVQLLVYPLQLLPDDHHSVLHTEEAIPDNYTNFVKKFVQPCF